MIREFAEFLSTKTSMNTETQTIFYSNTRYQYFDEYLFSICNIERETLYKI